MGTAKQRVSIAHACIAVLLSFLLVATSAGSWAYALDEENVEQAENGVSLPTPEEKKTNSLALMNYLNYETEEINASSNSRLYLDGVYSNLINNISTNVIDRTSQDELASMLDVIHRYQMVDVKRDRLEYIYEQNKAQAVRAAVPNPVGLLSATQSFTLHDLVISGIYMAVDSATSYQSAMSEASMKYLEDGWELDDEAMEALHQRRKDSFMYTVDMVRENELPDDLALTESSIKDFVRWKNEKNPASRIRFFEREEQTYRGFGSYWIVLAQSYYDNGQYADCLESVSKYEDMDIQIFRQNRELASVMPLAIDATLSLYNSGDMKFADYREKTEHYLSLLMGNVENDDWMLRYFAAQTYIELYRNAQVEGDPQEAYLQNAYDIALDNVNLLTSEQRSLNEAFLADVQVKEVPKGSTKQQKKEINQYNDMIKKDRKTELAPVYEPLVLNCELLFALADEIPISDDEKNRVDKILHESGQPLFLVSSIDSKFWFDGSHEIDQPELSFDDKQLTIPADCVSEQSTIRVTVTDSQGTTVHDDWAINKVDRGDADSASGFRVVYTSKSMKNQEFSEDSVVEVEIDPRADGEYEHIISSFKVDKRTHILFYDNPSFVRAD